MGALGRDKLTWAGARSLGALGKLKSVAGNMALGLPVTAPGPQPLALRAA